MRSLLISLVCGTLSKAIKPEHLAHWTMAEVSDSGLKVKYKLAHVRHTPARA